MIIGDQNTVRSKTQIADIVLEYFSYADVEQYVSDVKETLERTSDPSQLTADELKYGNELINLMGEYGKEAMEELMHDLRYRCITTLSKLDVTPNPCTLSTSWAYWNIAKQSHQSQNPDDASNEYSIGDPFQDEEVQDEIVYRRIGWDIYKKWNNPDQLDMREKIEAVIQDSPLVDETRALLDIQPVDTDMPKSADLITIGELIYFAVQSMDVVEED